MSLCRPTATQQWGVTSTYIFATHVKLSSALCAIYSTYSTKTNYSTDDACKTRG